MVIAAVHSAMEVPEYSGSLHRMAAVAVGGGAAGLQPLRRSLRTSPVALTLCVSGCLILSAMRGGLAQTAGLGECLRTTSTFLSDPSVPAFPDRHDHAVAPSFHYPYFSITLDVGGGAQQSYVRVAPAGDRVIGYHAALPPPPLPDETIPREQARQIGLDFARRHLPELFAEGGEVKVEPQEKIAANGAYLFSFCRLQQGVRVPPRALVGVRAYDGKVVRWTPEPQPLGVGLEPTLTIEQAVATLTPYLGKSGWVPGMVLESALEVVSFKQNQKLAWSIKMEMHGARSQQPEALEGFCFCHVDANDGTLSFLGDEREFFSRTPATEDLRSQHYGMGRELFAGFRSLVGVADRGASVFQ